MNKRTDIDSKLYEIWKEGFDAEKLSQYDFSDNVVSLVEKIQKIEFREKEKTEIIERQNEEIKKLRSIRDTLSEMLKDSDKVIYLTKELLQGYSNTWYDCNDQERLDAVNILCAEFQEVVNRVKGTHEIKVKSYGFREMQYLQNVCTCGWSGRKFYAYEACHAVYCREERESHLRSAK